MKRDYPRLIGKKLHEVRKKRGFTQEELADRANLNPNYYGGIERGEINVTIDTLASITEALQVELADVFDFGVKVDEVKLRKEVGSLLRKQKVPVLVSVRSLLENIR
jgi:transcriptional regulator with XRE-family HTH domain